jgi:hypothetical protein
MSASFASGADEGQLKFQKTVRPVCEFRVPFQQVKAVDFDFDLPILKPFLANHLLMRG